MNDLRKAAEQALKYFEDAHGLEDTEVAIKEALREALAETEQEPVGYAHVEDLKREHHDFWVNRERGVNEVPLYTAPPKKEWVGLTEEDGAEIWADAHDIDRNRLVTPEEIVRRIEAKLRSKNNG